MTGDDWSNQWHHHSVSSVTACQWVYLWLGVEGGWIEDEKGILEPCGKLQTPSVSSLWLATWGHWWFSKTFYKEGFNRSKPLVKWRMRNREVELGLWLGIQLDLGAMPLQRIIGLGATTFFRMIQGWPVIVLTWVHIRKGILNVLHMLFREEMLV